VTLSWNELEQQDLWALSPEESALLPGMTDKGRLGFAVQLKYMQMHGRFPERLEDLDPRAAQWLATQIGTSAGTLSSLLQKSEIRISKPPRSPTGGDFLLRAALFSSRD
jgi:hypothetical protein